MCFILLGIGKECKYHTQFTSKAARIDWIWSIKPPSKSSRQQLNLFEQFGYAKYHRLRSHLKQRHLSIWFSPPNQRALLSVKRLHGYSDRCLRFGFSYNFKKQKTKNKNKKARYFFAIVDLTLLLVCLSLLQ